MTGKEIKYSAKQSLANKNWPSAILITLIFIFVSCVYSLVSYFINIIQVISSSMNNISLWVLFFILGVIMAIVISPFMVGITRWMYDVAKGYTVPLKEVFYYYKSFKLFKRVLLYLLKICIRIILWCIVAIISGILLSYVLHIIGVDFAWQVILVIIITLIPLIILPLMFSLSIYLVIENDEYNINKCIKLSVQKFKTFIWGLIKLRLSFILWVLSCLLLIPVLYVYPYFSVSNAMYFRKFIEDFSESELDLK